MDSPIHRILHPKAVAFVGASNNISTMGTAQMSHMLDGLFPGRIYPIHLKEEKVLGLKAYKKLTDLPEVPDLLVLVIRNERVPEFIDVAGRMGTRCAVVISGGFAEGGQSGMNLQEKMLQAARKHDLRMVGPNCIGVLETRYPFNITYFPYTLKPGHVGVASHSGTYLTHMFPVFKRLDIGLSAGLSIGNEADLGMADCLEYFEQDEHTRAIALYIEGFKHGRKFFEVARRVSKTKPIVALYVGGTPEGGHAAVGHTAAMAADDKLVQSMFDQAGIIRADGAEELYEMANGLTLMPPMKGPNIGIITNSGGPAVTAADKAAKLGLKVPRLAQETVDELKKVMPHTGVLNNPVDVTFSDRHDLLLAILPELLLSDPNVDGLLVYGIFSADFYLEVPAIKKSIGADVIHSLHEMQGGLLDQFIEIAHKHDKPVVGSTFLDRSDTAVRRLIDGGIPFFRTPEQAVKALHALYSIGRYRTLQSGA